MNMKNRIKLITGVIAISMITPVWSADHRDGSISQDQPADIADTYAFINPNDTSKVVLGVTVNPYTVPGVTASFSTDLLYQIKIDNDGDFIEDLVIQATYDVLGANQQFTLLGPAAPENTGPINELLVASDSVPSFTGPSNATIVSDSSRNLRVFSGRTDDPFFIDLIFVRSVLSVPGIPALPDLLALRDPGVDLFAGLNVSSLMIELPVSDVVGTSNIINVWSTVNRNEVTIRDDQGPAENFGSWVQIDREGLPALNAALIPPANRNDFNRADPKDDFDNFGSIMAEFLAAKPNLPGDFNTYLSVARAILPDTLRLDVTNSQDGLEVKDGKIFLNGRAPRDDFIDLVLFALSSGAVTDDGLSSNDCTPPDCDESQLNNGFPTTFPFLGAEHQPEEVIPARN